MKRIARAQFPQVWAFLGFLDDVAANRSAVGASRLVTLGRAPLADLVGHFRDPGPNDEPQPCVFQLGQVRLAEHSGIGDHGHLRNLVGGGRTPGLPAKGLGASGVAPERVDHQWEPARIGEQPDGDLRLQLALLGEPGLAEPSPVSVSKCSAVRS